MQPSLVLLGDGSAARAVPAGAYTLVTAPVEGPGCALVALGGPAVATTTGLAWDLGEGGVRVCGAWGRGGARLLQRLPHLVMPARAPSPPPIPRRRLHAAGSRRPAVHVQPPGRTICHCDHRRAPFVGDGRRGGGPTGRRLGRGLGV